jgi:hypothetical protein
MPSNTATEALPAASRDDQDLASNSLPCNILPVTSYSTIFCGEFARSTLANHLGINILLGKRKKNIGGIRGRSGLKQSIAARHLTN